MGISIRDAESDGDLESWRRVRMAVLPNERCRSVAEMRAMATPETLHLVGARPAAARRLTVGRVSR